MRLDGRVAIVTGAGRGIGRTTALELARCGAAVVVNDLDGAFAEAVAAEIARAGGRAVACVESVVDRAGALRIASAAEALGSIDILVNNAASPLRHPSLSSNPITSSAWPIRTCWGLSCAPTPYCRACLRSSAAAS